MRAQIAPAFSRKIIRPLRWRFGSAQICCKVQNRRRSSQPSRQRFPAFYRPGPTCQHQKRSLERILRSLEMAEHAAANVVYHWSMTSHQGCEGLFVAVLDKAGQQKRVRGRSQHTGRRQAPEVVDQSPFVRGHAGGLLARKQRFQDAFRLYSVPRHLTRTGNSKNGPIHCFVKCSAK
jgi:hypothetical protein